MKPIQILLATLILLYLAKSNAALANWLLYADQDGGQGFYDPGTIRKVSKDKFNVLTYINIPEDELVYQPTKDIKIDYSMQMIQQYDCQSHTFKYIGNIEYFRDYDLKGPILHKKENKAGARLIEKGSPAENLERVVCNPKGRSLIGL